MRIRLSRERAPRFRSGASDFRRGHLHVEYVVCVRRLLSTAILTLGASLASENASSDPSRLGLLYTMPPGGWWQDGQGVKIPAAVLPALQDAFKRADAALTATCQPGTRSNVAVPATMGFSAAAGGSFTKRNVRQVAFVVHACKPKAAPEVGVYLVAVTEQNRLVTYALVWLNNPYAGLNEAFSARDLNGNGLSELVFVWSISGGFTGASFLDAAEFTPSGFRGLFSVPIGSSVMDEQDDPDVTYAYNVFVARKPTLTFVGVDVLRKNNVALLPVMQSALKVIPSR